MIKKILSCILLYFQINIEINNKRLNEKVL